MTAREGTLLAVFAWVALSCATVLHGFYRLSERARLESESAAGNADGNAAIGSSDREAETRAAEEELNRWKERGPAETALLIASGIAERGLRVSSIDPGSSGSAIRFTALGPGDSVVAALSYAERAVPGLVLETVSMVPRDPSGTREWALEVSLIPWDAYGKKYGLEPERTGPSPGESEGSENHERIAHRLGMLPSGKEKTGSEASAAVSTVSPSQRVPVREREAVPEAKEPPRYVLQGSFRREGQNRFILKDRLTGRTLIAAEGRGDPGALPLSSESTIFVEIDGQEVFLALLEVP